MLALIIFLPFLVSLFTTAFADDKLATVGASYAIEGPIYFSGDRLSGSGQERVKEYIRDHLPNNFTFTSDRLQAKENFKTEPSCSDLAQRYLCFHTDFWELHKIHSITSDISYLVTAVDVKSQGCNNDLSCSMTISNQKTSLKSQTSGWNVNVKGSAGIKIAPPNSNDKNIGGELLFGYSSSTTTSQTYTQTISETYPCPGRKTCVVQTITILVKFTAKSTVEPFLDCKGPVSVCSKRVAYSSGCGQYQDFKNKYCPDYSNIQDKPIYVDEELTFGVRTNNGQIFSYNMVTALPDPQAGELEAKIIGIYPNF